MVADPATEMAAMRAEITAVKEELAKASIQFNELQAAQTVTKEFMTDTNLTRLDEVMWKSYNEAFPEMHIAVQNLDEKTHGNFLWMQNKISEVITDMKDDQDWIMQSRGNGNDHQQRRHKASESKAISTLRVIKDKGDFKQWHDKLVNGIAQLYPKAWI